MRPVSASHLLLFPLIVGAILASLTLSFPFLWDDYDFMGRSLQLESRELLPDPQTLYYRPISRELYFALIHLLGASPLVGHILNLFGLLGAMYLLYRCTNIIAGEQAAVYAVLLFSAMGAVPVLVGWVSGSQDLLAIIFVLGALLAELKGRKRMALAFALGALLSKETALAIVPALIAASTFGATRPDRVLSILRYAALVLPYLLLHPALRAISSRGPDAVGAVLPSAQHSIHSMVLGGLATFNLLLGSTSTDAWKTLSLPGLGAIFFSVLAWLSVRRLPPPVGQRLDLRQQLLLSLLLILPPILITALFAPMWSPYYACFPALGLCIGGGALLGRSRPRVALAGILVYLVLGLWTRTVGLEPTIVTESNLRRTGLALRRVEAEFKSLRSSFPPQSAIYVSTQLGGPAGVYTHMYRFQAPRVWYGEPSLLLLDPNRYQPGMHHEFLFWLTPELDLIEIDLRTLLPRTAGAKPQAFAYHKTLRTFALGRAAGGKTDSAVRILTQMSGREPMVEAYDRRTAAALLIAADRRQEAHTLLRGVPEFSWVEAMEATFAILHEPSRGLDLDGAVMEAFGLTPSDVRTNRMLMRAFDENGFSEAALRFARRLTRLSPNDSEAHAVLRKWLQRKSGPQLTVPIPHS
jgi:hypothetical protein